MDHQQHPEEKRSNTGHDEIGNLMKLIQDHGNMEEIMSLLHHSSKEKATNNGNMMDMDDNMVMDDDGMDMNKTTTTPFCNSAGGMMGMNMGGMNTGMIMYMDGFRFSLQGNQPCLNLYFPSWTLDTPAKFSGAMLFVVFLAFLTEGLSKLRYHVNNWNKTKRSSTTITNNNNNSRANRANNNNTANTANNNNGYVRLDSSSGNNNDDEETSCFSFCDLSPERQHLAISVLHATQALAGYILMLAGMTFSIELLLCVIVGLGIGYAYFFSGEKESVVLEGHVTTNPCCSFMQEEANEVVTANIIRAAAAEAAASEQNDTTTPTAIASNHNSQRSSKPNNNNNTTLASGAYRAIPTEEDPETTV